MAIKDDAWNPGLVIRYCDELEGDIQRFGDDIEDFLGDRAYQKLASKSLEMIGETIKRLTPELTEEFDDVPWHDVCKMRDFMAHQYESVFPPRVWMTMKKDTPVLKERCQQILATPESRGGGCSA